MARYLTEFLGTFVLVLTIVLTTVNPGSSAQAPFAIGLALAIMIYAGGHVSGAHYNPAVTVAACLRGACAWRDFIPYVVFQVLGAIIGAIVALVMKGEAQIISLAPTLSPALMAEFVFTLMLAFVVLSVATVKQVEGNSYFGLAIGGTVTTGALAVGGISGGVFNPAVAVALYAIGILPMTLLLPYVGVQIVAGVVAAFLFRATRNQSANKVGVEGELLSGESRKRAAGY